MVKTIQILKSVFALLIPQFKKEDSKEGIKEIKEALVGVNEVSLFMCEKLKDGAQFQDGVDFYNKLTQDESFKNIIAEAWDKKEKIPAEAKDMDLGEGLELVSVQMDYVPKFVECFGK